MAKIEPGVLGAISGKVGGIVGSSWKGIPYVKARNRTRTKSISDKEKANRERFRIAQEWLRPLLKFVRVGFKGYTPTVEGFVAAKSYLMKNAMEGTGAESKVIPSRVLVSYGELPLSDNIRIESVEQLASYTAIHVKWDYSTSDRGPRDQVIMLAYDVENHWSNRQIAGEFRSKGADIIGVPTIAGRTYHIYAAFLAMDRTSQSMSVYLGEVKV
jgi:hypothetical protein